MAAGVEMAICKTPHNHNSSVILNVQMEDPNVTYSVCPNGSPKCDKLSWMSNWKAQM